MYSEKAKFNKSLLSWMRSDRFIGEINTSKELTFLAGHNKFSDWSDEAYKAMLGYGHGFARGLGYTDPDTGKPTKAGKEYAMKKQGAPGAPGGPGAPGAPGAPSQGSGGQRAPG